MKFRCKKTLTMGHFRILEGAEARFNHVAWNIVPELSVFTLFFKDSGFSLDIPQSVLMEHFEAIMEDKS